MCSCPCACACAGLCVSLFSVFVAGSFAGERGCVRAHVHGTTLSSFAILSDFVSVSRHGLRCTRPRHQDAVASACAHMGDGVTAASTGPAARAARALNAASAASSIRRLRCAARRLEAVHGFDDGQALLPSCGHQHHPVGSPTPAGSCGLIARAADREGRPTHTQVKKGPYCGAVVV